MTDSQQQTESFDMSEIMALAASKFGGVEFEDKEEENASETKSEREASNVSTTEAASQADGSGQEVHEQSAADGNNDTESKSGESPAEKQEPATEVKAPEIDPFLKALLEQTQPKQEEKKDEPVKQETAPEVKAEPAKQEPAAQPQQTKALQPNDVIDDATRQMLVEYRDLDEQSFNVMDQVAAAHARSNVLNLENAMVQVVQNMQAQINQQAQIIQQLQNQLSGVNTRITAPTLDQDIEAMKSDPAVAAYLPYMQNVLNGNDSSAKMQLVNTWKQSRPQANTAAPVTQAPVIERRTSNVSAAAEATAALANKTQSSMVQPTDDIKEGMELAAARFGPNR